MRIFAILAIALVGSTLNCAAQKIEVRSGELRSNIFDSNAIMVPEGKVLEIVDFFTTDPRTPSTAGRNASLETTAALGEFQLVQARQWTGTPLGGLRPIKLVGPTEVLVRAAIGSHVQYYLYYRLLDNVDTAVTQTSQTVVIPEDADGDVEIILESSKDLINWAAANPGTYNSQTTEQRFFRVRAVKVAAE